MPKFTVTEIHTTQDQELAFELRTRVFVKEQGVNPDHEIDEIDKHCIHVITRCEKMIVGTGRLIWKGKSICHIGRMAVDRGWRKFGVGTLMLQKLEKIALENNYTEIHLHAQTHAEEFYIKNGFIPTGEVFLDENITHILMVKNLN